MDPDPARGVTDADGRFHFSENLYAAGPALFPSIGSPNPMLTGIALSRRTGDRIMAPPAFAGDRRPQVRLVEPPPRRDRRDAAQGRFELALGRA